MAVLPLIVADDAIGVLALYAGETGFLDVREQKLLTELAGDIAFAIDYLDKRERLDYLAFRDPLTGLANRTLFMDRLAQYLRGAAGSAQRPALVLLDLERFKNINDSLSRPAGDALLRPVAEWLARNAPDPSLLSRVGGDHFALVLAAGEAADGVARQLEPMLEALIEHAFHWNEASLRIAVKAGIDCARPWQTVSSYSITRPR